MVSVADITFPRGGLEKKSNCDVTAYFEDLVHFVRKKPTRKMRRVKHFLDFNLKEPDQTANALDRELSYLYHKYCEEQAIKRKIAQLNFLKPLKSRNRSKSKKKDKVNDISTFKEYGEYLKVFADRNCNLFAEVRPEPDSADIFMKAFLKQRGMSMPPINRRQSNQEKVPEEIIKVEQNSQEKSVDKGIRKTNERVIITLSHTSSFNFSTQNGNKGDNQKFLDVSNGNQSKRLGSRTLSFKKNDSDLISLGLSKENSRIENNTSGSKIGNYVPSNNNVQETKKKIKLANEDASVITLKEKIAKYSARPQSCKKEIPFRFDQNLIGSKKVQMRQQEYGIRTGLIQPSKANRSFAL